MPIYVVRSCVFVILKSGEANNDHLKAELNRHVREIGPIAVEFRCDIFSSMYCLRRVPGKIMRRILRSIAAGQVCWT
jgi:acyl-coenzyme A synthetase/AMP-(fatty) acid ligase